MSGYGDLVSRLEGIAEELDDLAFEQLREAAAAGRGRPADDKRLLQARRAIDKAAGVLRQLDEATDDTFADGEGVDAGDPST